MQKEKNMLVNDEKFKNIVSELYKHEKVFLKSFYLSGWKSNRYCQNLLTQILFGF